MLGMAQYSASDRTERDRTTLSTIARFLSDRIDRDPVSYSGLRISNREWIRVCDRMGAIHGPIFVK